MMYSVEFLEMAGKIDPVAFTQYLENTGWTQFQIKRDYVKVFQLERGNDFFQVTIPMDRILRDYQEAMCRAICTAAEAESKSAEQLMICLLNLNADTPKMQLNRKRDIDKLEENTSKTIKIIGRIQKLESLPNLQTKEAGKITVIYLDEAGRRKTATVKLQKADYDKAIEAHGLRAYVEIVGQLSAGKNQTMECESFRIID